jgi:hypothetical protein
VSATGYEDQHAGDSAGDRGAGSFLKSATQASRLYKAAEARPGPSRLLAGLPQAIQTPVSPGVARLQAANHANIVRRGEAGRQASARLSEAARRDALEQAATQSLTRIADALKESIMQAATSASASVGLKVGWTIVLNEAHLRLEPPASVPSRPWGPRGGPVFEVAAFSALSLQIPGGSDGYEGRSHSLWYCDAREAGRFQWFETAFMLAPLTRATSRQEPFALNPGDDSGQALVTTNPLVQVAWPFTPVSVSDLVDFADRWTGWLADAIGGKLSRPNPMPERRPQGSWRTS